MSLQTVSAETQGNVLGCWEKNHNHLVEVTMSFLRMSTVLILPESKQGMPNISVFFSYLTLLSPFSEWLRTPPCCTSSPWQVRSSVIVRIVLRLSWWRLGPSLSPPDGPFPPSTRPSRNSEGDEEGYCGGVGWWWDGVWGIGFMRGWSMVLQKKSRKSNSTATCVVMDEGVR